MLQFRERDLILPQSGVNDKWERLAAVRRFEITSSALGQALAADIPGHAQSINHEVKVLYSRARLAANPSNTKLTVIPK